MTRMTLHFALAAVAALPGCAAAASAGKAVMPPALAVRAARADYVPWLAGRTLHYQVTVTTPDDQASLELSRTFSHVSADGAEATLMANWLHLGNPMDQEVIRFRRGTAGLEAADRASGTWAPFLRLPLQGPAPHKYAIPAQPLITPHFPAVPLRITQHPARPETVQVPAGRYAAQRVDLILEGEMAGEKFTQQATLWLASGLGEVRYRQRWDDAAGPVSLERVLTEVE